MAFYYGGLTPENIGKQRYSKLQEWHNALGIILAEHQLSHINFISFPHVSKNSQQSIISSIRGAIEGHKVRKNSTQSGSMKEMYEKMVGALRGK